MKGQRKKFRRLALACEVPFIIIDCQASESALLERLGKRQRISNEVSEADVEVMQWQRSHRDALSNSEKKYRCVVNTEEPLNKDAFWLSQFESLRANNNSEYLAINK